MTKVQLKNQVLEMLATNKATKAFTADMTALMENFVTTSKKDTVTREKIIIIDDIKYVWCNRHEVYEVSTNFKHEKADCCLLGHKIWVALGKTVNAISDAREAAIEGEEYDKLPQLTVDLKHAKEVRGGRYNFEDNKLQFNDIDGFNYDVEDQVSPEAV